MSTAVALAVASACKHTHTGPSFGMRDERRAVCCHLTHLLFWNGDCVWNGGLVWGQFCVIICFDLWRFCSYMYIATCTCVDHSIILRTRTLVIGKWAEFGGCVVYCLGLWRFCVS